MRLLRMEGQLPSGWTWKRLKYVAHLQSGETISPESISSEGEYPVYGGNGFRGFTSQHTHSGDFVLIGRQGALCGNINYASGRFWASEHAIVADTHGRYNVRWLGELLRSCNLNQLSQSAAQPGIAVDVLGGVLIPVPPQCEQEDIATFIGSEASRIDSLIAAKERLLQLLGEKRQAIITRAVTRGIDPDCPMRDSGVPWLGEIPAYWKTKRLKYLFRLTCDQAADDNDYELLSVYTDIGVKPRRELEPRGNKASTTDQYWIVRKGDLIVNKLLAWMGAIGASDFDGVTSPAYDVLRPLTGVNVWYYHYLLRADICLPELRRRSYGIMDMRLRLYFDQLGDVAVPLPSFEDQNAIVESVRIQTCSIDKICTKLVQTVALLRERRSALISAAVTGRIPIASETVG